MFSKLTVYAIRKVFYSFRFVLLPLVYFVFPPNCLGKKQPVVEDQDQNLRPVDIPISASEADNDIHDPPLPRQPIPVTESSVNPHDSNKTEHEEL